MIWRFRRNANINHSIKAAKKHHIQPKPLMVIRFPVVDPLH